MNPLCCIAPVSLDRGGEHGNVAPAPAALKPRAPPGAQIPVRSSLSSKQLAAAAGVPAASPAAESAESAACRERLRRRREGDAAVAGVLYKWVNYGKGWRSRWFVLEDGVLSYYKVHGPDKILVGPACEAGGVRVIGEDSLRR
ncbi:Oxysterol-binding protein-related protein 1D [Ananas comosus]|uniref:Oxysterol-binding protein-related protein 1D n=1 Tax=Ananas comosus TaxID=4615 RepID=A0A199VC74_ANACO|nr:Oxysterol-binding protein-related protein 1D [Ananas comosus]